MPTVRTSLAIIERCRQQIRWGHGAQQPAKVAATDIHHLPVAVKTCPGHKLSLSTWGTAVNSDASFRATPIKCEVVVNLGWLQLIY